MNNLEAYENYQNEQKKETNALLLSQTQSEELANQTSPTSTPNVKKVVLAKKNSGKSVGTKKTPNNTKGLKQKGEATAADDDEKSSPLDKTNVTTVIE